MIIIILTLFPILRKNRDTQEREMFRCLERIVELTTEKLTRNDGEEIVKEYSKVEQVPPAPGDSWAQHDTMISKKLCKKACKFKKKNRYSNLFPFDKSIVNFDSKDHYINASWMKLLPWLPNQNFIATMGPMHPSSYGSALKTDFDENVPENTCPDFWRMVWEKNVKVIVMLCQIQDGFTGCSRYFPEKSKSMIHDEFTVKSLTGDQINDSTIERVFEVTKNGHSESKKVHHYQFLAWPNYGVPGSTGPIGNFLKLVHKKAHDIDAKDPEFVVHCSGGIGRSGTFLTAYGAYSHYLNCLKSDKLDVEPVDITETVIELRKQRHPWMVEGERQYKMCYAIIIDLLKELYQKD